MARAFDLLVVCHIEMALAERHLEELERKGQSCPNLHAEAVADMAASVADRLVAEAGAIPIEFKLKKLLQAAKRRYARTESAEGKRVASALIADLETRYNIAVQARRRFMGK